MYGSSLFVALTLLATLATAVVYGLGGVLVIDDLSRSARWSRWRR